MDAEYIHYIDDDVRRVSSTEYLEWHDANETPTSDDRWQSTLSRSVSQLNSLLLSDPPKRSGTGSYGSPVGSNFSLDQEPHGTVCKPNVNTASKEEIAGALSWGVQLLDMSLEEKSNILTGDHQPTQMAQQIVALRCDAGHLGVGALCARACFAEEWQRTLITNTLTFSDPSQPAPRGSTSQAFGWQNSPQRPTASSLRSDGSSSGRAAGESYDLQVMPGSLKGFSNKEMLTIIQEDPSTRARQPSVTERLLGPVAGPEDGQGQVDTLYYVRMFFLVLLLIIGLPVLLVVGLVYGIVILIQKITNCIGKCPRLFYAEVRHAKGRAEARGSLGEKEDWEM